MADAAVPKKLIPLVRLILREEGARGLGARGLRKIAKIVDRPDREEYERKKNFKPFSFDSIVDRRDVMRADWTKIQKTKKTKKRAKKAINWIISPPGNGGGHQNMFRFIEHLDKAGYRNNIYLYTTLDVMPIEVARNNVSGYSTLKNAHFYQYDREQPLKDAVALFATGWETAYPVLNEKTDAKKFYFVQDFEPYFYAIGTEYILAENTYKFGFHGITAGNWLKEKLASEYGMICDAYDFGADGDLYKFSNHNTRKEVFFYARPVTERRAFDLGIMALELFHKKHPEFVINLAGWDISDYDVPFPYVNHKSLRLEELPELYNRCAVGLVLSLTNMSLLPLELLACGAIPVVNDGENNRLVSDNQYISYSQPSPVALANAMSAAVTRNNALDYAKKAAVSTSNASWAVAKDKFMKVLEREIRG